MIRRSAQMNRFERPKMKGGQGTVRQTELLAPDELLGKGRLLSILTLEPGCSIGAHTHTGEAEIFYILEGEALAHDNGEQVHLYPGDLLVTGDGCSHDIRCCGETVLRLAALILYT